MDGSTNLIPNLATVATVKGNAIVRKADGTELKLQPGMKLAEGDVVITAPGAFANIQLAEGSVDCGNEKGDALTIDKTVLDFFADAQDVKVVDADDAKDAFQTIATQTDFNDLEATAAGGDAGDTLSGNTYVTLQYINTVTSPTTFTTTSALTTTTPIQPTTPFAIPPTVTTPVLVTEVVNPNVSADGSGDIANALATSTSDLILDEAGLTNGSSPVDGGEIAKGLLSAAGGTGPYTYTLITNPDSPLGYLTLDPVTGEFIYTLDTKASHPAGSDVVTESFTYLVTDADGNTATNTIVFRIVDDGPVVDVTTAANAATTLGSLRLDETVGADRMAVGETSTTTDASDESTGVLAQAASSVTGGLASLFSEASGAGADGEASSSRTFGLVLNAEGVDTTLTATAGGAIKLYSGTNTNAGTIEGIDTDGDVVFRIAVVNDVNGNPQLQTTLYEAISHSNSGTDSFDEDLTLALTGSDKLQLAYTVSVTDNDGDTASSTSYVDLATAASSAFVFADDGPVVDVTTAANAATTLGSLRLDETVGADRMAVGETSTTTDASDESTGVLAQAASSVTGGLASLFSEASGAGADGEASSSRTFGLVLNAEGVDTTLTATAGGAIKLYSGTNTNAGTIEGIDTDGDVVFRIAVVNDVNGNPQLQTTLYEAISHSNSGTDSFDEDLTLALTGSDKLQLAYTVSVTDNDGDTASSTSYVDLATAASSAFVFADDGPVVDVTTAANAATTLGSLRLDETVGADRMAVGETSTTTDASDESTGVLAQAASSVTGGLASLFSEASGAGADGEASSSRTFGLVLNAEGVDTTLTATAGGAIKLYSGTNTNAGTIEGIDTDGDVVFRIAVVNDVNGNPQLQTTLYEAISHSNSGTDSFDEDLTLALTGSDKLQLAYTVSVTDNDGDTASSTSYVDLATAANSAFVFADDGPVMAIDAGYNNYYSNTNTGVVTGTVLDVDYGSDGGSIGLQSYTAITGTHAIETTITGGRQLDVYYDVGTSDTTSTTNPLYTLKLYNDGTYSFQLKDSPSSVLVPLDFSTVAGGPQETLTITGTNNSVTFNGLIYSGESLDTAQNFASGADDINPSSTGFGIGNGNLNDNEGFTAEVTNPVEGLQFTVSGAAGNIDVTTIRWVALDSQGVEVDSGSLVLSGLSTKATSSQVVNIVSDVEFSKIEVRFDQGSSEAVRIQGMSLIEKHELPEMNLTFTARATDGDGDYVDTNFNVNVVDGLMATDDVETAIDGAVSSTVVGNDVYPTSSTFTVGTAPVANGETTFTTAHGTVTMKTDGSYTYTANPGYTGTDAFEYTLTDASGNFVTATVRITSEVAPNIVATGSTVDEAGLLTGTNPSATSEVTSNTFTLSDTADIKVVSLNGTEYRIGGDTSNPNYISSLAGLVGESFNTANGTVEITGYNSSTGTFTYYFTLTSNTTDVAGVDETNTFTIGVSDDKSPMAESTFTITIIDDAPSVDVTTNANATTTLGTLRLDETVGADRKATGETSTTTDASDESAGVLARAMSSVTGGLAGLFGVSVNAGADGEASGSRVSSIGLSLSAEGAATNLIATNGGAITLHSGTNTNAGTIEGVDGAGDVVFRIAIVNDVNGNPQLQTALYEAIKHANNSSSFDEDLALALTGSNKIQLSYTVSMADGDGDPSSDTSYLDLATAAGSAFVFADDGPAVNVVGATAQAAASLEVDETTLSTNATVTFANLFSATGTSSTGSDGGTIASPVYSLGVVNGASGLFDTLTGQSVVLSKTVGGVVEGRTATSGDLVFTVTITANGVELDQVRALKHTNTGSNNESTTLSADNFITITRTDTVTDGDGDVVTSTATVNLGKAISFLDDGPSLTGVDGQVVNINQVAPIVVQDVFTINYGADGKASQGLTLAWNGAAPAGYSLVKDLSDPYLYWGKAGDTNVFKVQLEDVPPTGENNGSYTFTLLDKNPQQTATASNIMSGITGGSNLASFNFDKGLFGNLFDLKLLGSHTDSKTGLRVADTITISATELGVHGNTLDEQQKEFLRFDVVQNGAANIGATISSVNIGIAATANIKTGDQVSLTVHFNDGSADYTNALTYNGTGVLQVNGWGNKTVDWFEISPLTNNENFKITGISVDYALPIALPSNLQFELSATDHDGDVSSLSNFTVGLSGVSSGALTLLSETQTILDTVANDTYSDITGSLVSNATSATYSVQGAALSSAKAGYDHALAGQYGTLYINSSTGAYLYDPNDAAVNGVISGASDTFTIGVTEGLTTATNTLQINIAGADDQPANITLTDVPPSGVAENMAAGTVIATLATTDSDNADTFTYTLVAGADGVDADNGLVEIVGNDIKVKTGAVINYETNPVLNLNVKVTDAGGLTYTKAFTLDVTNVNEAPTITSGATGTVAENAATSTVVYTAAATDVDAGTTLVYSLSGTDAALFNINSSTGAVTLKASANYEAKPSYSINVVASDGTLTDTKAVTVNVTNVNEAPTITSGATGTVAENAATSTVVYTAAATDVDAGTTLVYSLSGTDAALFNINSSTGAVTLKASANYEAKPSYSINVVASDGTLTDTKAVTVNVTNVNEAPTITSGATGTVAENAATSTVVYTAAATDVDAGTTLVYSLSGTDAALFNINSSTGAVTLKASANYEAKPSYSINVVASDGTLTDTKAVTVNVTNVNEAPTITSGATGTVAENAATSTVVYTAVATDVDAGTTLVYSLSGTDAALFNINSSTGAVTFKSSPDFENPLDAGANNVYDISVSASDGTNSSVVQEVAITVTNVAGNTYTGGGSPDSFTGTSEDDDLNGAGNKDTLDGAGGNDILIGGSGDDALTGGTGADIFKWSLGDQGTTAKVAVDSITDFSVAQGDKLDLADLLQGESKSATSGNSALSNYLSVAVESGKVTISIDHDGTANGAGVTQKIVLDNYSTTQALATDLNTTNTSADIITALINSGKLITD